MKFLPEKLFRLNASSHSHSKCDAADPVVDERAVSIQLSARRGAVRCGVARRCIQPGPEQATCSVSGKDETNPAFICIARGMLSRAHAPGIQRLFLRHEQTYNILSVPYGSRVSSFSVLHTARGGIPLPAWEAVDVHLSYDQNFGARGKRVLLLQSVTLCVCFVPKATTAPCGWRPALVGCNEDTSRAAIRLASPLLLLVPDEQGDAAERCKQQ